MPTLFEPSAKSKKPVITSVVTSPGKRSTMGPLTCFAVSPEGVRFETQEESEEVILFLRQHLIVLVVPAILVGFLLLSPPVLFPLLLSASAKLPISLSSGYPIIGTIFWYIATFGFAIVSFLRWFFNIYIITNLRVVDIDFKLLLYKEFSEANLSKIQDLSFKTGGILATIFNYGDVLVETAGEVPSIEFDAVPHPDRVVQTISELTQKAKGSL